MDALGQTICLTMIVRDEAPTIARCLESVRPWIDRWVVVDTGSTDETPVLVERALRGIPGELAARPWVDFAHNRNQALALAGDRADYVLTIDADELLEADDGVDLRLSHDAYGIEVHYQGLVYLRRALLRASLPWRYRGVVHELVDCEQAGSEADLPEIRIRAHHDGARARQRDTYRRDAELLERAWQESPGDPRTAFYLAQSYRDAGEIERAIAWYRRRAELGGWVDEIWFSLGQIAALERRLGASEAEVVALYEAALALQHDRAEPVFRMAMVHQGRGEHGRAHELLLRAAAIPRPPPDRLFVEAALYDFRIAMELAVASHHVGDSAGAIALANQLLAGGKLPGHLVGHVLENRRFSLPVWPAGPPPARLDVRVPLGDSPAALDELVESLLAQRDPDFTVSFVGRADHASRERLCPDPRFRLDGPADADVVVPLPAGCVLADEHAVGHWRTAFASPEVAAAYGRQRDRAGRTHTATRPPTRPSWSPRASACAAARRWPCGRTGSPAALVSSTRC